MTDVFLQRKFAPAIGAADVLEMSKESSGCFGLHRVDWHVSALSTDGGQMICHFSGPDAESVRAALHETGAEILALWHGTIHDAPGLSEAEKATANVVVQRSFEEPVTLEEIQAIEDEGAWCLETHHVKFIRTYFSNDRKKMICLYQAPDAESVRLAQRQAQMPVDQVWAFTPVRPGD
jgi:hypothetical protein